jgi:DNA-binding CsgD family transcriptional regulator/tetratricopeptide (TPR) repeat protein
MLDSIPMITLLGGVSTFRHSGATWRCEHHADARYCTVVSRPVKVARINPTWTPFRMSGYTVQSYRELMGVDQSDGSMSADPRLRLRGRECERAQLSHLLDAAVAGDGGRLLLEGATGAGKTALLRAFCGEAASRNISVGISQATAADANTPMSTLSRAAADGDGGLKTIEEIRAMLSRATSTGPLAIVIDDAGDADDASLQAVGSLARELSANRVVWLLASRPTASRAYHRIARHRDPAGWQRLRLQSLAGVNRLAIVRDLLEAAPDPDVAALAAMAGDNLTELIDILMDGIQSGGFVIADGAASLSEQLGPLRFDSAVAPRLGELSPAARRLLDLAAVLGMSSRLADVTALLGAPAPQLAAEIRELLAAGLIVDDGTALSFPHRLVRRTVLDRLPAAVHRAVSRDVALHLMAAGASAVDIGPYVLGASSETQSGPLLEARERLSASVGVGMHLRALEFAVAGSRQWMSLVAPAARALVYGGRLGEAEALIGTALAGQPQPSDEMAMRLVVAETAWLRGRAADRVVGRDPALDALMRHPSQSAGGGAKGEPATLWTATEPSAVLIAADAAIGSARDQRDHRTLANALLRGSDALVLLGRMSEALAYATESASIVRRTPGVRTMEARIWQARALYALDRLDDAQGLCEDVLCEIHDSGNIIMLPGAHAVRARVLLARGQLADAAAEAEAGIVAAESTGGTYASLELLVTLAVVTAAIGQPEIARHAADRCAELSRPGDFDDGCIALARTAALVAERAPALKACVGLVDGLALRFGPLVLDPGGAPALARVALDGQDRRRAAAAATAATRLAALNRGVLGWAAAQSYAEGMVAGEAATMCDAAVQFTRAGRHFTAAIALADAAVAAEQHGESTGSAWWSEATAALTAMGADAIIADRRRRCDENNGHAERRHARTASGWGSLTTAEVRVVTLAARGISNKEIARQLWLSPHTVGTHIRHALEKLGIRSRVEMARQAGERTVMLGSKAPERVLSHDLGSKPRQPA